MPASPLPRSPNTRPVGPKLQPKSKLRIKPVAFNHNRNDKAIVIIETMDVEASSQLNGSSINGSGSGGSSASGSTVGSSTTGGKMGGMGSPVSSVSSSYPSVSSASILSQTSTLVEEVDRADGRGKTASSPSTTTTVVGGTGTVVVVDLGKKNSKQPTDDEIDAAELLASATLVLEEVERWLEHINRRMGQLERRHRKRFDSVAGVGAVAQRIQQKMSARKG